MRVREVHVPVEVVRTKRRHVQNRLIPGVSRLTEVAQRPLFGTEGRCFRYADEGVRRGLIEVREVDRRTTFEQGRLEPEFDLFRDLRTEVGVTEVTNDESRYNLVSLRSLVHLHSIERTWRTAGTAPRSTQLKRVHTDVREEALVRDRIRCGDLRIRGEAEAFTECGEAVPANTTGDEETIAEADLLLEEESTGANREAVLVDARIGTVTKQAAHRDLQSRSRSRSGASCTPHRPDHPMKTRRRQRP